MKKKIVVLGLAAVMVFNSSIIFAGEIDLSGYSLEELFELKNKVDTAIFENDGKTIIPYGRYIVGEDIEAGSYVLTAYCLDEDEEYINLVGAYYTIWKSTDAENEYYDEYTKYSNSYSAHSAAEKAGKESEGVYHPNLDQYHDGYNKELSVEGGPVTIRLTDGEILELKEFWEPGTITIEKSKGLIIK